MHDITLDRHLYNMLTKSDEHDEFNTSWINNKSICAYNNLITFAEPIEFVPGQNGYAVFDKFLYKSRLIPYRIKITNGFNSHGLFDIKISPRLMIPSIYIRIKSSDIHNDTQYYNSVESEGYTYIFGDDIDIVMLSILDVYKYYNFDTRDEFDSRDYESSVSEYLRGNLDIELYFLILKWPIKTK